MTSDNEVPKKKKRGRKPKKKTESTEVKVPKKRGRKPRGGKIVKKNTNINFVKTPVETNIILHLKCNTDELQKKNMSMLNNKYTPQISQPDSFSLSSQQKLSALPFETLPQTNAQESQLMFNTKIAVDNEIKKEKDDVDIKNIWKKLSNLKYLLRYNSLPDKRSACFWCTCSFDNPAIHIPSKIRNGVYDVYGCFCSPQCAVAYLKNEPLDHSVLWERYSMINDLYGKIFGRNIKPAPSPYYTLNKYYGNLTIQEYRKLLNNDKLLMIVDKPMSKILPELYEDNNELPDVNNNLLSNEIKNTNYRLKSKNLKREKRNIFSQ